MRYKEYCKIRDHCHYRGEYGGAAHSICNLKYSIPKKIPIAFYNGSNYDYHFIIKKLAEKLKKKQFTCLGENTEKCITFTVPIEKEVTKVDKNGEKITKNISYILLYYTLLIAQDLWQAHYQIFSIIFLKEFIKSNVNKNMKRKKCQIGEIKYKYCDCFLDITNFNDDLIDYKCLYCNKNYNQKFVEKLKAQFLNRYTFSKHDNNKFILLLRKGVYPYEYIND